MEVYYYSTVQRENVGTIRPRVLYAFYSTVHRENVGDHQTTSIARLGSAGGFFRAKVEWFARYKSADSCFRAFCLVMGFSCVACKFCIEITYKPACDIQKKINLGRKNRVKKALPRKNT